MGRVEVWLVGEEIVGDGGPKRVVSADRGVVP